MVVSPLVWMAFVAVVLALLAVDLLLVSRRGDRDVSLREAAWWSAGWVALGLAFGGVLWWWAGPTIAGEYFAGYLLEKSMSVDNVFVFAVLFAYFAVPPATQRRVLLWGVLGALVFRGLFIGAGAVLLARFAFIEYVFGAFLIWTAWKLLRSGDDMGVDPDANPLLRWMRRHVPMSRHYDGARFFTRATEADATPTRPVGARIATPLLAVLLIVETTDVIFAVDSIPAIFGVTKVAFVVFTSNVFAILGLRALYFLLAGLMGRLHYLDIGISVVLGLVGVKMLASSVVHVPTWVTLVAIVGVLGVAIGVSLLRPPPVAVAEIDGPRTNDVGGSDVADGNSGERA